MVAMLFHVRRVTRQRLRDLAAVDGRPMREVLEQLIRREYKRRHGEIEAVEKAAQDATPFDALRASAALFADKVGE